MASPTHEDMAMNADDEVKHVMCGKTNDAKVCISRISILIKLKSITWTELFNYIILHNYNYIHKIIIPIYIC